VIEASVIFLVRLGDQRRDLFKGGEDVKFLPVGVPRQHLVEEPEMLDLRRAPGLPRATAIAAASMPAMSARNALWMATTASIGLVMIVILRLDVLIVYNLNYAREILLLFLTSH
jgi:hypothetical protein